MGLETKIEVVSYNFNNFYRKEYNESFVIKVFKQCLNYKKIVKGDQKKQEPDLICEDNIPIEITFISDHEKTSLIQRLNVKASKRPFESLDIIEEVAKGLNESIISKTRKRYCYNKVNLCLISPLPIDSWTNKGLKEISKLFVVNSLSMLDKIKERYLHKGNIENIFILVPTYDRRWCLIDLDKNKDYYYSGDINDSNYPFFKVRELEEIYE